MYDPRPARFISEDPLGFDAGDANLYRYVTNSPTNYTDPTGLLVEGLYDRETRTLTLWDTEAKSPPITIDVFSGYLDGKNNPALENIPDTGPIPQGKYEILDYPRDGDWYRLDRIDSIPRNDVDDDLYNRNQFRLHPGSRSYGCITIPEENKDDWKEVENMLERTTTETVEDNSVDNGKLSWLRSLFRLGKPKKIKKFGTITVR